MNSSQHFSRNKICRIIFNLAVIVLAFTVVFTGSTLLSAANETKLKVVVSIKPIHSLVANVMKGVGNPELLLKGASSPHSFSLKPSQSRQLQNADLIFWVGHSLEASLQKPIATIGANALSIELEDLIDNAENDNNFNAHHLDKHEHTDGLEDDHNANVHLWLNPDNAKIIVQRISKTLGKAEPENADIFTLNAENTILKINVLIADMEKTLSPINKDGYILFHDAYKPFEQRFGFHSSGVISINPESKPSAARLRELQRTVKQYNVGCVFTEPQFSSKISALIIEGSSAKIGMLDPLGFQIPNDADLYFTLMNDISNAFSKCIGNKR